MKPQKLLAYKNPTLAREWHRNKNAPLTPKEVSAGSGKYVWWTCPKGHDFQAYINNRNRGSGCPFCSGHKVSSINSLKAKFPNLAKQWHPTKNGKTTPASIHSRSHKKIWWICKKGHVWEVKVAYRTSESGSDCPICGERVVSKEHNLALKYPHIAREWHPAKNVGLTPKEVRPNSTEKAWWKCKNEHEWEHEINERVAGQNCPYCSGHRLAPERSLAHLVPKVAKEWNEKRNKNLTPSDVAANSGRKAWWTCKAKGHEWNAIIQSRTKGIGCPYCAGKKVATDNNLAAMRPDLALEWHPTKNGRLKPTDVFWRTYREVWWICSKSHTWKDSLQNRAIRKGCPFCSGKRISSDNNLKILNPVLASEWHPSKNGHLHPKKFRPQSNVKVWWLCKRKHEWKASISNRFKGKGCPFCNNTQTSEAEIRLYSELKSIFPTILHREKVHGVECDLYLPDVQTGIEIDGGYWHQGKEVKDTKKSIYLKKHNVLLVRLRGRGLSPLFPTDLNFNEDLGIGFAEVVAVLEVITKKCRISASLKTSITRYLKGKSLKGQKEFSKLRMLLPSPFPGKSLQDKNPKIAKEWHKTKNQPLTPRDVYPNSTKRIWWVCKKKHDWDAPVNDRNQGNGCPYCSGKRVDQNNSLATLYPEVAKSWHPTKNGKVTASMVTPGSNMRFWWLCKIGHEWQTAVANRTSGKTCRVCSYIERGRKRRERRQS